MKFITAALLFLLTIPGLAGAQEEFVNTKHEIDTGFWGAMRGCGGLEDVYWSGTVHVTLITKVNGSGFTAETLIRMKNDDAANVIGAFTGQRYKIHWDIKEIVSTSNRDLEKWSLSSRFKIIGLYDISVRSKYELDPVTGLFRVIFDNFENLDPACHSPTSFSSDPLHQRR